MRDLCKRFASPPNPKNCMQARIKNSLILHHKKFAPVNVADFSFHGESTVKQMVGLLHIGDELEHAFIYLGPRQVL